VVMATLGLPGSGGGGCLVTWQWKCQAASEGV
jgi:hypothetical protein